MIRSPSLRRRLWSSDTDLAAFSHNIYPNPYPVRPIDKRVKMTMLTPDAKQDASTPLHNLPRSVLMKTLTLAMLAMGAGLLVAGPSFAQTAEKQKTQDGNSPTTVGPGSAAYKQKTQDGGSPTMVGPASGAYKQKTQSLSHGDVPVGVAKQN
jgi:hypothetical protein